MESVLLQPSTDSRGYDVPSIVGSIDANFHEGTTRYHPFIFKEHLRTIYIVDWISQNQSLPVPTAILPRRVARMLRHLQQRFFTSHRMISDDLYVLISLNILPAKYIQASQLER